MSRPAAPPPPPARLDDAARAGWLYYVAGNTQDEIAGKLGISRQVAQRLVAMAVASGLVQVRLDHPIARCMDLAAEVAVRWGLDEVEVVPTDPDAPDLLAGIASAAAALLERTLRSEAPRIVAVGTGRTLRAMVDATATMDCPQHRIVALLGNMMRDGQATRFNTAVRLADRVGAPHYPLPLPVLASTREELAALQGQSAVQATFALAARADLTLVGIGQTGPRAPMVIDGFVSLGDMETLLAAGAAGEIISWVHDAEGRRIDHPHNALVASAPLPVPGDGRRVIAVAAGAAKHDSLRAALRGRLLSGLVTDEAMAGRLLAD